MEEEMLPKLFEFSFLLLYILLVITLVITMIFSQKTRSFLAHIHASPSDPNSWLRYALSTILVIALGIAVYQATYDDSISGIVALLIGIAISGKVTASGIDKTK